MPRLWFKTRELTTEGEEVEEALRLLRPPGLDVAVR
jgi:hypothetical protein